MSRQLDSLESAIFNDGERLIPGVTHDQHETTRHLSAYTFFRRVIEHDNPLLV